jgi:hypothetical protein
MPTPWKMMKQMNGLKVVVERKNLHLQVSSKCFAIIGILVMKKNMLRIALLMNLMMSNIHMTFSMKRERR